MILLAWVSALLLSVFLAGQGAVAQLQLDVDDAGVSGIRDS